MPGVVQLETSLVQEVRKVGPNLLFFSLNWDVRCYLTFESLVPPHADAPPTPAYAPYLHLARMSDDDPHLLLRNYQSALGILIAQNK